jgi:hypothetical protein
MRTRLIDEANATFGIPESDQILAEQADAHRLPVFCQVV